MMELIVLILAVKIFARLIDRLQRKTVAKQAVAQRAVERAIAAEEKAIAKAQAAEARRKREVEKERKAAHEKEMAAERIEFYLAQLDKLKETADKLDCEINDASPARKEKLEKRRFALDGQMFRTQEKVNEAYYRLNN